MDIIMKLQELRSAGESFVLSTIVKAEGSTPRSLGTKMLVLASGETIGTIGGGKLEFLAIEDAKLLLNKRQSSLKHYDLIPEGIGMHCGGSIDVFHEVYVPEPQVILFGAGHVAQPLAKLVAEMGYAVFVIDPRPDLLNEVNFGHSGIERICEDYLEGLKKCQLNSETICFVVSLGQEKEIVEAVLQNDVNYIGVMGSRRKVITMRKQLFESGLDEEKWKKVRGPVGLDLGGETPYEVAFSIASEMIKELRGGNGNPLNIGYGDDSSHMHTRS